MGSFGIGAKLRQERVGKGLAIDDISRDTRIAPRFLEAIETDDYSSLPGLVFTRNFVRQYALTLHLDPDPLLAELPKQDESTVPFAESSGAGAIVLSQGSPGALRFGSSLAWLVVLAGVAASGIYPLQAFAARTRFRHVPGGCVFANGVTPAAIAQNRRARCTNRVGALPQRAPVQVSLTAHAACLGASER